MRRTQPIRTSLAATLTLLLTASPITGCDDGATRDAATRSDHSPSDVVVARSDDTARAVGLPKGEPRQQPDDMIAAAYEDAAFNDPRVLPATIQPRVEQGVMRLVGVVGSLKEKRVAERLARDTAGVVRVENDLEILRDRSDDAIKADIIASLAVNPVTEPHDIEVRVEDGVARLTGDVDTFTEKAASGDTAARTRGVWVVDNDLTLSQPTYTYVYEPYAHPEARGATAGDVPMEAPATDEELMRRIEGELLRDPLVDSWEIHVSVDDGEAILTGSADTHLEKLEAEENAREGGAQEVDNRIQVI